MQSQINNWSYQEIHKRDLIHKNLKFRLATTEGKICCVVVFPFYNSLDYYDCRMAVKAIVVINVTAHKINMRRIYDAI